MNNKWENSNKKGKQQNMYENKGGKNNNERGTQQQCMKTKGKTSTRKENSKNV